MSDHENAALVRGLTMRERNWLGDNGQAQIEVKFDANVSRLNALIVAVQEVAAFEQAGGDEWWGAHDKLYRAAGVVRDA